MDKFGSSRTLVKIMGQHMRLFITFLGNKGSEETAQKHRLAFTAHIHKAWMYMQMKTHASSQSGHASIEAIVDF